jgi:dTDP-4-dehydrorhamnose 3,5-epimerase-like enzyme
MLTVATIAPSWCAIEHLPFAIERVFWVYDVPNGAIRGQHAHRYSMQALTVQRGWVWVRTEMLDGEVNTYRLQPGDDALLLPPFTMKQIQYQDEALLVVFASASYDKADYVEPAEFRALQHDWPKSDR